MARLSKNRKRSNTLKKTFIERVRAGNVTPILSDEIINDLVLQGNQQLVHGYAGHIESPIAELTTLHQLAKYTSVINDYEDYDLKSDFLDFVKDHLLDIRDDEGMDEERLEEVEDQKDSLTATEVGRRLGYLNLEGGDGYPLLALANLPLPIYLTTSPFTFLEAALEKAGKTPISDYCRWHPGLSRSESRYKPTKDDPLVFHLFGIDTEPASLLLTEDHYLQFLVSVSQGNGQSTDPIPDVVRQAITTSALVPLGFNISSWAFRVLFWGLIKQATMTHRGICCLQIEPSEAEKKFLQTFLKKEAQCEVYWGNVAEYTQDLNRRYDS